MVDAAGEKVLVNNGPNFGVCRALIQLEVLDKIVSNACKAVVLDTVPYNEGARVHVKGKSHVIVRIQINSLYTSIDV